MKTASYLTFFVIFFLGCSQEESQPYVEHNTTLSSEHEQGYIETH